MLVQTMRASTAMADALKNVGKAMSRINGSMNLPALQKIMQDFVKETEKMDVKEEMMGDLMDDVMGEEV